MVISSPRTIYTIDDSTDIIEELVGNGFAVDRKDCGDEPLQSSGINASIDEGACRSLFRFFALVTS